MGGDQPQTEPATACSSIPTMPLSAAVLDPQCLPTTLLAHQGWLASVVLAEARHAVGMGEALETRITNFAGTSAVDIRLVAILDAIIATWLLHKANWRQKMQTGVASRMLAKDPRSNVCKALLLRQLPS